MQSDILGCLGIGKDGEIVIGTIEGNNIITNISEGFDQKTFDDLNEGLQNKQRCRVSYIGKNLIKLWVDEKVIFESRENANLDFRNSLKVSSVGGKSPVNRNVNTVSKFPEFLQTK